jgi:uncharacterized protein (DUF58 family)
MFNERWHTLFVFVILIGILIRSGTLVAVGAVPIVLDVLARALRKHALKSLGYQRRLSQTRSFVGESTSVTGRIVNQSRIPVISCYVRDDSPTHFRELDPATGQLRKADPTGRVLLAQQAAIGGRQFVSRTAEIVAQRRGMFFFPKPALRAVELLGMAELNAAEYELDLRESLLVYPRTFTMEAMNFPARQPMGPLPSMRRLVEDLSRHMGSRDYVPGDPYKMIHWKATARRGSLQTRVHEHTAEPVAMVLFNVTTFADVWYGSEVERFEWSVSIAASLARWASDTGMTIGYTSNGTTPRGPGAVRVPVRRTPDQLANVLETMAMIGPYSLHRFEEFLLMEQHRIPANATQIVVTPMFNEAIELALTRLLAMGKRLAVICTDWTFEPVSTLNCPVYHLPPTKEFCDWLSQTDFKEPKAQDDAAPVQEPTDARRPRDYAGPKDSRDRGGGE